MTTTQELHDELLANRPEGAAHDPDVCQLCGDREVASDQTSNGGTMSDRTYSEEEVTALVSARVAEATKALQEKIDGFEASTKDAEVDAKVAAAKAEAEATVEDLQKKLDEAVLAGEAAKTERDEIVAFLEGEKEKAEKETELAKLRTERAQKVAEVASFPEDYVKASVDRWASMSEEAFTSLLEDYKAVAVKPSGDGGLPQHTALTASREEKGVSPVKEVLRFRDAGIDPRNI